MHNIGRIPIGPNWDVILCVGGPEGVSILMDSKILAASSPVFKAMFDTDFSRDKGILPDDDDLF
jgi:hypothetical protein